jgi:hypothetical protein
LLLPEIVSLLNPDQSLIQFGRSEQFLTGLQKAVFFFRAKFNVTASGIRQPNWAEDTEGIKEVAMLHFSHQISCHMLTCLVANKINSRRDASRGEE